MQDLRRFGNRIKQPSTVEIIHELRMMILADKIKKLESQIASESAPVFDLRSEPNNADNVHNSR